MPDFKKITQMIQSKSRERYVIVEEGRPKWIVLSMEDYERLVGKGRDVPKARRRRDIEEALTSYREKLEGEEEAQEEMMAEETPVQEPEFYLEDLEELSQEEIGGVKQDKQELSPDKEAKGPVEFDEIPF